MMYNPDRRKIQDNDFELVEAINSGRYERFQELVKR
jgi:hypothetical protein